MIKRLLYTKLVLSSCCLLLLSCEKEVKIKLNNGASQLVIEGQIENGQYPIVILTKSIGYFSTIDLNTLQNSFVHGAVVKVADGNNIITLKEYTLDTGLNGANKFYLYSIDTADPTAYNFKGVFEHEYHLTVDYENKTYESITKIPNVKPIDSIWVRPPGGKPKLENSVLLFIKFKDPDTLGNYVRYFTSINGQMYLPPYNSVYDDGIINGTTIDSLSLQAGYDRSKNPNLDSLGVFFKGDTVSLKWCALDKGVYNFFQTFEYSTGTIGNPFASPVNVISNIKGGALGVWAGYGASYSTIIIPK